MTTLAANTPRAYELGDENDLPVIASDIIYEGAAVGDNASGYARPLVAGDPFRGFALAKADNSAGSAGDINVKVRRRGDVQLTISGVAITDVGKDVFASDDNAFTLTQSTNTRIGKVKRYVTTNTAIVEFEESAGGAQVSELTDNSAGTPSATAIAALSDGSTYANDVAALRNNLATLTAKVNYLIRRLGN